MKKTVSVLLIACSLLLSGCGGKTGETVSNINDVLSKEPVVFINDNKNIADEIREYVTVDISGFDVNSDEVKNYVFDDEYNKRIENVIITDKESTIEDNDKVNITFRDIELNDGSRTYELNIAYDFDLTKVDDSFKNGLLGKTIGSEVTIKDCKMPNDKTSTIKVKINYATRSFKGKDAEIFKELLPDGIDYKTWLKASIEEKADKVNEIWEYLLKTATIKTDDEAYTNYFDEKYNNAVEYYKAYGVEFDDDSLRETIKKQVNKELIAYYYAKEYGISLGTYSLGDTNYFKYISLYYGYTEESFRAEFTDTDTVDNIMLIDMVGAKLYESVFKSK